jgi:hypothetical protein
MRRLLYVVFALCGLAGTAQAYVLPADYLLRMMADKRRDPKLKDLSAQLDTTEGDESFEERLYLKRPERLRTVQQIPDGAVFVEREGLRGIGTEAKVERYKGPVLDLTAILLMPRGKDLDESTTFIIDTMKGAGIDMGIVTLARWEDRRAYVIGARVWEPEKPQLWIDKNTFLPIRLVLFDKAKKELVETRWLDFGSPLTGNNFPRIMETYRGGKLTRRAEVTQIKVNQDLPETLFDVP